MKKRILFFLFVFVSLTLVLSSCGESSSGSGGNLGDMKGGDAIQGNEKYEKLLSHYDNMIKILKDNKGNREKALKETSAYTDKYADEIEQLTIEIEKNPLEFIKYAEPYAQKLEEFNKSMAEIMTQP
ncbi:MAG: hypothetical protein JW904_11615 [Spirochaetales bacterium]|nr:hypothetical protein [Spirochaetales bacterium]